MQKRAEFLGIGNEMLGRFTNPASFSKELLGKYGMSRNYERISLHLFLA